VLIDLQVNLFLVNVTVHACPIGHITSWIDDVKSWPPVSKEMIVDYVLERRDIDGLPAEARKSMGAYNYVDSDWVSPIN